MSMAATSKGVFAAPKRSDAPTRPLTSSMPSTVIPPKDWLAQPRTATLRCADVLRDASGRR